MEGNMKMRRNLFVLMLFVTLFVNCNKVNSMEKKKEIKTNESSGSVSKSKSCKELEKYNVKSEKIELKNKNLEEISCILDYKNVKELDLRWNKISDLKPLEKLEKLEVLKINFNQIEDITPLLNLKNLKELWLHNNNIKDIRGIGRLSKLNHLDVSFNPLKYGVEEIEKLRSLKRLEVREVPKEIVDYIYENYNKFTMLDKIFIENRMAENSKKRENETKYPNFSEFEDKINDFETVKIVKTISVSEISREKLPEEVYKIVNKYDKEAESEDEKITGIESFRNKDYGMYIITYPYAYAGQSNRETIFVKKGKVIAREIAYAEALLESMDGDNLFLSVVAAPGATNYIVTDLKEEISWQDDFRDYGFDNDTAAKKNYKTGRILKTASKDDSINLRREPSVESTILYKLKNGVEVEEIYTENNWKYVYFYNEKGGYYMKGYIHKSQLK
jgi:possible internalin protein